MEALLINFRLDRPTWFYLSFFLVIAVYFRFNRFWSLRNLDLALLLSLSPGLLLLDAGAALGFAWLFGASSLILLRLLLDPLFDRRPRLTQNLNTAGLTFLLGTCVVFNVASILTTKQLPDSAVRTASRAERLVERLDASKLSSPLTEVAGEAPAGPTATVFTAPAVGLSRAVNMTNRGPTWPVRIAAIFAHAAVLSAMVMLGYRMFGDIHVGIAMSTLYLLLPCTAYNAAQVNHVLPGGLILWAVVFHRNPLLSGGMMGLACGTLSFPVFLLPVWLGFYGWRNSIQFAIALVFVQLGLLGSLTLTSVDAASFRGQLIGIVDWSMFNFDGENTTGAWAGVNGYYRMPVFALFLVMVGLLSWWPAVRSVELLLARSAAIIVGTQFWYPQDGGVYLLWYVPLVLAVIFRPTLAQWTAPTAAAWSWRKVDRRPRPDATPLASAVVQPVRPLFR